MINDPELYRLFKAESIEHLEHLDSGLLNLEKSPTDQALLQEMFRESHSLKGAARMLGLNKIELAAHSLEDILNAARKGNAPLTVDSLGLINASISDLHQHVQDALSGSLPPDPVPFGQVEIASFIPSITENVTNPLPSGSSAIVNDPFRIETVRVETHKLDELLTQVGELSVIRGRTQHRLALMNELLDQWVVMERDYDAGSLRYAEDNMLFAHFGNQLKKVRDAHYQDCTRLGSTVNLVEDNVRNIRLLPLSALFSLFPRMVRDLVNEHGKDAGLILEGGDITVDKRILEEMKDPLMHLLRNAIDHGIELPDEREHMGKPRKGMVRIRATREHDNVLLEVQDDGRGLDLAAIQQEAKKRGLFDEQTLALMSPEQLQQLILMPGFSTSAYVTELSGRGVGLDVVRVNVEQMKGSVQMHSDAGLGLTIQLHLPLSISTTRLLLIRTGGQMFGLPIEFVNTTQLVRDEDIFTLEGHSAILVNGSPIISAWLDELLTLPAKKSLRPQTIFACIVLQVGNERFGLFADELLAEEEVVPKPLGVLLRRVRNVSALAVLGTGDISVILNPADLWHSVCRNAGDVRNTNRDVRKKAVKTPVLLVEDSVLIRAMEKRILEDGGYEVYTAVDGADAVKLLASRPFSAVISDIMMPNMDGFALTTYIRAEPRYKDLPVILVTTLTSDEDKRHGLNAGANAYITKPSFDSKVLLDTLKRLVVI